MLHYPNIIKDPYPDIRDDVTGEWLPQSFNQIVASARAELDQKKNGNNLRNIMSLALSILK